MYTYVYIHTNIYINKMQNRRDVGYGQMSKIPTDYLDVFRSKGITTVVRLNKPECECSSVSVYMYTFTYVYTCIYVYMYIYT